jgi:DNA-binding GntR family transcriptional regulator
VDRMTELAELPRFLQIARDLRELIVSGGLAPGDEVPSERAVAARWKVARPTAARALQVLRAEGWTEPRRGAGTFVRASRPVASTATAAPGLAPGPIGPDEELIRVQAGRGPADLAELFGLDPERLCSRHRIVRDADGPVEISTTWFAAALGDRQARLLEPTPLPEGDLALVESAAGRRAVRAADLVQARHATAMEARILGVGGTDVISAALLGSDQVTAVLQVRRVMQDADGATLLVRDAVLSPRAGGIRFDWPVL